MGNSELAKVVGRSLSRLSTLERIIYMGTGDLQPLGTDIRYDTDNRQAGNCTASDKCT